MSEPRSPEARARPGEVCDAAEAADRLDMARAAMDEYAREIFDLWFGGQAEPEVAFVNDRWRTYMSAAAALQEQILNRLRAHAEQLRAFMGRTDLARGRVNLRFHGVLGGERGDATTGYHVLGASSPRAGGCQIAGSFEAVRVPAASGPFAAGSAAARALAALSPGPFEGAYCVTYGELVFTFCTRVDAGRQWTADGVTALAAHEIARALGGPPPRDFVLRIRWAGDAPVRIDIPAPPVSGAPPPLRFR